MTSILEFFEEVERCQNEGRPLGKEHIGMARGYEASGHIAHAGNGVYMSMPKGREYLSGLRERLPIVLAGGFTEGVHEEFS